MNIILFLIILFLIFNFWSCNILILFY